ncbi:hypothetical protein BZL29_4351 [Mycobacterium kansasii]|uniref:Uncharacterized protein n=1 Tax=Mycobacterium kansasii TaxID=1768 RepID=A0A1V3X5S0_MYCKA|nr:hypothetical protein BZL29_4351 [Mycobacterium kansasii]
MFGRKGIVQAGQHGSFEMDVEYPLGTFDGLLGNSMIRWAQATASATGSATTWLASPSSTAR